jgi:malate dehydrogenase (oxaloacetate-decarboxylating)
MQQEVYHREESHLLDTVRNVRPTALIGVSGQPGAFDESSVRAMASGVHCPVILPLSNPSSHSEANPADLFAWTNGRAVVGVGSPFPPVERNGKSFKFDQTNNSYVFPGIGLGAIASQARYISDGMFMAAARTLAMISPAATDPDGSLLPSVAALREVSFEVARAVALRAQQEGLATKMDETLLRHRIRSKMWTPVYAQYLRIASAER